MAAKVIKEVANDIKSMPRCPKSGEVNLLYLIEKMRQEREKK